MKFSALLLSLLLLSSTAWAGVDFNGTDDYVSLANESSFDFTSSTPLSVSLWVKPNVTRSGTDAHYVAITKLNGSSPFQGWEVGLWYNNTNCANKTCITFEFIDAASKRKTRIGQTDLSNGVWFHLAVTYDGSGTVAGKKLYVNGTLETMVTLFDNVYSSTFTHNLNVGIAARTGGTFRAYTNIDVEEVAIWDVELTANEISLLANKIRRLPLQVRPSDLLTYNPLDECQGGSSCSTASMFLDLSGNANHGSPTGDPVGKSGEVLSYP